MKLSELKQRVYSAWECLSDFNDALIQQENFLQEVRAFGDLRRKPKTLYEQTGGKVGARSTLPFIGSESFYRRRDCRYP